MKRVAVLVLGTTLAGVAVNLGCDRLANHGRLRLSGTLELTEHAIGAPVPGRLGTLKVDEGDEVQKGQLLATLEHYDQMQRDYERVKSVAEQGGATQQAVEQAVLALTDQAIVSPVDGVVLLKVHEPGEVVPAGGAVVVVGDRSQLWVKVYVPEGQVNRLQLNQAATLRFDGLRQSFKGHVSFIAPQAEFTPRNVQTPEERVTQTFAVKVALDEPTAFLRPGVAADVTIDLSHSP